MAPPRFMSAVLASEKKTPPVEKRGFQSRPGLEGRHHSGLSNAPSANWFLGLIAGFPAEAGNADKTKEGRNIDERFDPLHAAVMRKLGAWFPGPLGHGDQVRAILAESVVPAEGIEPPTFGLQNRCSTAELIRRFRWLLRYQRAGPRARACFKRTRPRRSAPKARPRARPHPCRATAAW